MTTKTDPAEEAGQAQLTRTDQGGRGDPRALWLSALRRDGWRVNAKRVYRLYREMDLQLRRKTGEGQAAGGPPTGDTIQ
jgi:hypothetical protein